MRIKGLQIRDHEKKKKLNVPDDTIICLIDINCHTRIQSILISFEKASKKNFSKIQALWAVAYKNRIVKSRQMVCSQLSIKIL